ncbi:MAG: DUF2568 domain-containing protein [Chloroflexi bacterium]|nr:MAG: DUF2568 domain-containing protein [Chloroflexota bacterium]
MDVLKALNLLVRFLLELCMLAAVGYWGFGNGSGWTMKVILGIGLPILVAALWWLAWRLSGLPRLMLELALLGSGAVALFASNRPELGWVYTVIVIVNKILMIVWKQ